MGIVAKQGFYNSIAGYVGIVIGYVNTVLLFPNILNSEQFGLTRIILAAAAVFAQFSQLGITNITVKFFPSFKNKAKKHYGIFLFVILIPLIGFLIFSGLVLLFKSEIIELYSDGALLFVENFSYVFVATFFLVMFSAIDAYLRGLFKTVPAYMLKSVVLRLIWLFLILAYYFGIMDFESFLFWFIYSHGLILLGLIAVLINNGELKLVPELEVFEKKKVKQITKYGGYTLLSSSSMFLANRIDVLMIGALITVGAASGGLDSVAIYSVAFYIGSVIAIPFQAMSSVLAAVVSTAFEKNDKLQLQRIYTKTSESQLAIGALIFLGVWLNVDNLFEMLPPEYGSGRYVILLIALAKLFDMVTGVNGTIIQYSEYYPFILTSNIIFVLLVIISNLVLIPLYGLEGAALATFMAIIFHNTLKGGYLWFKMKMFPFTKKSVICLLIIGFSYAVVYFIPEHPNFIVDIIIKSVSLIVLYVPLVYVAKISDEINTIIKRGVKLIGIRLP